MIIVAGVFVALAAVLHVYIFLMESIWWTRPSAWKRFGLASQADADTTRPMAYNQGFYNLFLAAGAALGLLLWRHRPHAGRRRTRAFFDGLDGAGRARVDHHRPPLPACGADPGHAAADRACVVSSRLTPLPPKVGATLSEFRNTLAVTLTAGACIRDPNRGTR